jgi:alkanesulfonate monooxygenase SsuD/methylene tetrahydromethanopterin reductase-like flavin-dependent oxidoreductase (luciferase family)
VAPVVLALPNRHPTVLAKMAETLDRLSAGRLVLALGSGAAINEPAYHAFGLAQRSPRQKVAALAEAIDILRGLWSTSSFSYAGQHFQTEGATIEPKSRHPIPIWLGVFGDRMVDLVGRKADGWLPTYQFLAPEPAYEKLERIRKVAEDAGRNPDEITYAYNIPVLVEAGSSTSRGADRRERRGGGQAISRRCPPRLHRLESVAGRCGRPTARAAGQGSASDRPRAACVGFARISCASGRAAGV